MLCLQPGWLPALLGLMLTTGAIASYVIAVLRGSVTPYAPFISEAAGHMPESGIFTICLAFTSMLSFLTMYVRYSVVKELVGNTVRRIFWLNRLSLFCGILSTCGMLVVGAYPVTTIMWAHNVGAYTIFVFGVIYCFFQTFISYHLYPEFNGLLVCHIRLFLSCVTLLSLIVMAIYYALANDEWDSHMGNKAKDLRIPGDKGFVEYTVSSVAEWVMAIFFVFFFFSFIREFRKLALRVNAQLLVKHMDEDVSLRRVWGQQDSDSLLRS